MVPNGWKRQQLGSLAKIYDGTHQTPNYVDEGIPFYSVEHVTANQFEVTKFISEFVFEKESSRVRLERDDILMTRIGDIGTARLIDWDVKASFYVSLALIKHGKDFFSGYLANYINGALFRRELWKRTIHVAFPKKINLGEIGNCEVLLPPLPEQKKIAQILSTWDKAITTTEQLLANSQQQKKALMQQLLTGKKRLLDKNGVRFSGEWRFQKISEVSIRVQRKTDGGEHPILTISSLSGFVRQDERYSRYMAGESVKSYILLKKGEFAYNKGNSKTYQFGCIFDLETYESGLVPHVYVCFKLKKGLSHRYFKYLFEADYLKSQLGALVNTGVRNNGLLNIKPAEFLATRLPVPSFEEQERIADVLHASSESIKTLQQQLDHLRQEKKALMQQLLTGKRRVQIN